RPFIFSRAVFQRLPEIGNFGSEIIRRPNFADASCASHHYDVGMTNSDFRISALPTEIAEKARAMARTGASDHALITVDSPTGYPCRHCLRWAQPGERVVLFPFSSIAPGRPYSETGPIFVHEQSCARYATENEFPEAFRNGRVLRAYDAEDNMSDAVILDGEEAEAVIAKLFADSQTAFLQARSATRGCYTFRIERA
ncbi:MAG: DUF1203 domain-containing protein, partial [Chthoniobacterales bacterium]